MITTYAVSFLTVDCGEADRIALIDLLTDWQMANHPFGGDDESRPGAAMRVREGDDDPVFRLSLTESTPDGTHVETTTATVWLIEGVLGFDLRIVSSPRTSKVVPHTPSVVKAHVAHLVRDVLEVVPTYDADYRIAPSVRTAATELEGQELAAFALATKRRLPVIVEVDDFERRSEPVVASRPAPLTGLAHIWRITTPAALRAFADMVGLAFADQATVLVLWDSHQRPHEERLRQITPGTEPMVWQRVVDLVTTTAARSLAQPHVPPPPRRDIDLAESPTRRETSDESDDSLVDHVEQLEATVDELQAALADADRIIADQRAKLERKDTQIDELVLRNVNLEAQAGRVPQAIGVANMKEAMRLAQKHCPFLVFHERAIESGEQLEGPDPSHVLADLVRLNDVARQWMSGEISGASVQVACRQMGLDYAPGISATARQKYVEDYVIEWRGRPVVAAAHLRRGKRSHLVRTHVYFDDETRQVVVAYIGRHLRDKGSSS
ncbi:MAG: hypothetical protein ACO3RB_01455 [Ilumatobacteraceae bacterium]